MLDVAELNKQYPLPPKHWWNTASDSDPVRIIAAPTAWGKMQQADKCQETVYIISTWQNTGKFTASSWTLGKSWRSGDWTPRAVTDTLEDAIPVLYQLCLLGVADYELLSE